MIFRKNYSKADIPVSATQKQLKIFGYVKRTYGRRPYSMRNDSQFATANKEQKVLQCFYCGNSTLMNLVGEHTYNWDECQEYYGYFNYKMFSCPVCGKVTFVQQYWDCAQSYDENGIKIITEIGRAHV